MMRYKQPPDPYADKQRRLAARRRRKNGLRLIALCGIVLIAAGLFLLGRSFVIRQAGNENDHHLPVPFVNIGPPYVVAIDPGHGGEDPGAIGLIQEVELTERTAELLYGMLQANPDFTPVYSRAMGQGATIRERVRVAKEHQASLFISIHANADPTSSASGFECFPVPPGRNNHDESVRISALIAQEMAAAGSRLRGERGIRFLYYDAVKTGSKMIVEESDSRVREEKSFGVLDGSECPAVLVEQCFLTSEQDVAQFGSEEGCKLAARSYYKAICTYFNVPPVV